MVADIVFRLDHVPDGSAVSCNAWTPSIDLLLRGPALDIDNPPEASFEAMRRLRPEPPDEETVDRIVEIYRAWCRKQEARDKLKSKVPEVPPPAVGP